MGHMDGLVLIVEKFTSGVKIYLVNKKDMSNVKISRDQYGRCIEVTVSFKYNFEIDRYEDDMVPVDATTMPLEDAKAFVRGEIIDMSPNDLWELIVNRATEYKFDTDDKE